MGTTIVTEEAERLVREGGLVNRKGAPDGVDEDDWPLWRCPYYRKQCGIPDPGMGDYGEATCTFGCVDEPACITGGPLPLPLPVVVFRPSWRGEDQPDPEDRVGRARVVDAHHADYCRIGNYTEDGVMLTYELCHPDAQPDVWHWTLEPVGGDA